MRFTAPNVIAFSSRSFASRIRVARVTIEGIPHIAFGSERGQSPTNAIEGLASFIWETCYPAQPFTELRWFDVQRSRRPLPLAQAAEDLFWIRPVHLHGELVRPSPWFGPRRPTVYAVSAPRWEQTFPYTDLPPQFRRILSQDLLEPLREFSVLA